MHTRVRALGLIVALTAVAFLVTSNASLAQQANQQPKKEDKKLDKAQREEIQAALKLVDDVVAGQPGPSDITLTWQNHFLKARDQRTFVPLVVTFDGKLNAPSVLYYLRVVNRNAAVPAPAVATEKKDEKKAAPPEYPFEDVRFVDVKATEASQPHRLVRAISLPAGEYDVYVLIRERVGKDKKVPVKGGVLKQALNVPDYWNGELTTSSVILTNKAEQLTAPATEVDVAANPYLFGQTKITPSPDNKFSKADELSIVFQVYNTAAATGGKPDVSVEYNFYRKAGAEEKFFNKTNPQEFNATTLPPQFDMAAGHTLVGGLSIPLASFPEGDYRLEIKVHDKAANKSKVENISLTVGA